MDIQHNHLKKYNVIKMEELKPNKEIFKLKKTAFNTTHDITVKGYEVELYAEDVTEPHVSTGVYSVLFDEWVEKPVKENIKIDKEALKKKAQLMMDKIDEVMDNADKEDYDKAVKHLESFKEKIKKYRNAGLEKEGEFSYENLVFKVLRRNGYLDKLWDFQDKLMDKKLSIETKKDE